MVRKPFGEITNTPMKSPRPVESTNASPNEILTPTANLKMLIRVASETSDQLHSRRRALFSSPKRSASQVPQVAQVTQVVHPRISSAPNIGQQKYTRKDKSLGLLCERFIHYFPERVLDGEYPEIQLDDLAKQMNTERRRIYDIVNVLEAVQMMTKVGKNLYKWHGKTHEKLTLAWLKELGLKLKLDEKYQEVLAAESDESILNIISPMRQAIRKDITDSNSSIHSNVNTPSSDVSPYTPSPLERKTSLGVACQKFLMLFLVAPPPKAMNLEFAAKVIHASGGGAPAALPDAMMKTRIRRLYDIANILQSLKLIQKIHLTESKGGKRPAFQYIGPNVDHIDVTKDMLQELPATRQRHSLFTFGKNLFNGGTTAETVTDENAEAKIVKKRNLPDTGFSMDQIRPKVHSQSRHYGEVVSMGNEGLPMAAPRGGSSSLLDLSNACEMERRRMNFMSPPSSSTSHIIPPVQYHHQQVQNSPLNLKKVVSPRYSPRFQSRSPRIHNQSRINSNGIQLVPVNRFSTVMTNPSLPSSSTQSNNPVIKVLNFKNVVVQSPIQNGKTVISLEKKRESPMRQSNILQPSPSATSSFKIIKSQVI